jgi:hypothetical protein
MTPAVPYEAPVAKNTIDEAAPNVSVQNDPYMRLARLKSGDVRFWLRNQGIGWMVFNVPTNKAQGIRDYLIANTPKEKAGPDLFGADGFEGETQH